MTNGYRRTRLFTCIALALTFALMAGSSLAATAGRPRHVSARAARAATGRVLIARWRAEVAADRVLVTRAEQVGHCQDARARRCVALDRTLQHAGTRLARAEGRLREAVRSGERTRGARAVPAAYSSTTIPAPLVSVRGQTLVWALVARVPAYVVERRVSGSPLQDYVVDDERFTPPPAPGSSVEYRVRAARAEAAWSSPVTILYPPAPVAGEGGDSQAAPQLTVTGETLSWRAVAGAPSYILRAHVAGGGESYSVVSATSVTPPADPGAVVGYEVRTAATGSAWSTEVSISYPAATPPAGEGEEAPPGQEGSAPPILGIVGGSGWGPQIAAKVIAAGFSSERLEAGGPGTTDQESFANGFRDDQVIVGNTPDEARLASVNIPAWVASTLAQVKEAVSFNYTLLEVGNEMYLKGGVSEPVKYAEMYTALAHAIDAAGIRGVTLIFDSFGDYETAGGERSLMSEGRGWIGDALQAEPELKSEVSAFSNHPYGIPGVKYEHGDWGMEGLEAQHREAISLGFTHTGYYATEYGESATAPASSLQVQAERIKWAYDKMLAMPFVKGIWYYQLHDDSTGGWGLVSGSWEPRPALAVLEGFIREGR